MGNDLYSTREVYAAEPLRYQDASFRRCGNSGVKMSPLTLGLWHNFGGVDSFENGRAVVRAAFDHGITCFDLANNYGPPYGSAEENFGKLMQQDFAPFRDEMFIASKAGYDMWPGPYGVGGSRKYLLASLDQSLRRMKLAYVDLFYHHCMDAETPLEESMGALVQAVRSGKALYAGISNYSPEQAQKAIAYLAAHDVPCLVEQSACNMLQRTVIENGLLGLLEKQGVGFAAYSPLAQGLLTGKYNRGVPADSRAAGRSKFLTQEQIKDAAVQKVVALSALAEERGQTMSQFALSWLLSMAAVTTVIIGASRVSQLLENHKAMAAPLLTEGELCAVRELLG